MSILLLPCISPALGNAKEVLNTFLKIAFLSVIMTVVTLISYAKICVVYFILLIILDTYHTYSLLLA